MTLTLNVNSRRFKQKKSVLYAYLLIELKLNKKKEVAIIKLKGFKLIELKINKTPNNKDWNCMLMILNSNKKHRISVIYQLN